MTERNQAASKKMGRPKAEKPKKVEIGVCLDEETSERLTDYCQRFSISKGEAIRRGLNNLFEKAGA